VTYLEKTFSAPFEVEPPEDSMAHTIKNTATVPLGGFHRKQFFLSNSVTL